VSGVLPDEAVTVIEATWHGSDVLTVTYRRSDGAVAERLLFRDDEPRIAVVEEGRPWSFDGDARAFQLASEAKRIDLAYLFDPYVAVSTSLVDPLPHQITAVYEAMLTKQPLTFLLADDPGAGKTIMTGLLIRELIVRGDLRRCLVVAPGSLVEQWQVEMFEKFHLRFAQLSSGAVAMSASGNPFTDADLLIARLDKLSRDEDLQLLLENAPDWDLVVFDEAHKLSAQLIGDEVKKTKRRALAERVRPHARNFLLLTATPHNGKQEDFELFMGLLDPDRFAGHRRRKAKGAPPTSPTADLMRRLMKEQLVKFDRTPLFPPRFAYVVPYELSHPEADLYEQVTSYVREEMEHAEKLKEAGKKRRGLIVGFALTVLQRRLASSPAAIHMSLQRRLTRLERALAEAEVAQQAARARAEADGFGTDDLTIPDVEAIEDDEATAEEAEAAEDEAAEAATAARSIPELQREIARVRELEALAARVRRLPTDTKWTELATLLQEHPEMRDAGGGLRKLVVFTEHKDTLNYLVDRITTYVGQPEAVVAIHGGLPREQRRAAEHRFKNAEDCLVLVATDAAGEGINLQRAHLMVNYDLPWNPNRLEQRFGRIHRIGQEDPCHLWNLVAHRTREGDVYHRLLEKLAAESEALGGAVFDVLGELNFEGKPLRDLLIEAVRYGDSPEVREAMTRVIDTALDIDQIRELLRQRALGTDLFDLARVNSMRDALERAEAGRLQPHYVRTFFLQAFAGLGGKLREREAGRYQLTKVPGRIRDRARELALQPGVLGSYERVVFEKELVHSQGAPLAEFVSPGHPLLEATISLVLQDHRDVLRRGSLLVDETDPSTDLRALVYLEHAIVDARPTPDGHPMTVSRRLEFVELTASDAHGAGAAPYLDYSPATPDEREVVQAALSGAAWLIGTTLEARATTHAIDNLSRAHLAEIRERTLDRVERTRRAVHARLTYEANYWDAQALRLREQERAGRPTRLASSVAQQRADDAAERLRSRLHELDLEAQVQALPPVVVGGAIVVPRGLLDQLVGKQPPEEQERVARETKRIELAAMGEVIQMEVAAGREPRDVSGDKLGWDVESREADGRLRFIEVKGRAEDATTVTVTQNEIQKAFNIPDRWYLAIVSVDSAGNGAATYLRRPFVFLADPAATSVNYSIRDLVKQGEVVEVGA
jgi:superfamily II DNA or RNA helicase